MKPHAIAQNAGRALGHSFQGAVSLAKSFGGGWQSAFGQFGGAGGGYSTSAAATYTRRSNVQWCGAYDTNSRVRSPIHRKAEDVAAVQWHLYKVDPNDPTQRTEVHKHRFLEVLGLQMGTVIHWVKNKSA